LSLIELFEPTGYEKLSGKDTWIFDTRASHPMTRIWLS